MQAEARRGRYGGSQGYPCSDASSATFHSRPTAELLPACIGPATDKACGAPVSLALGGAKARQGDGSPKGTGGLSPSSAGAAADPLATTAAPIGSLAHGSALSSAGGPTSARGRPSPRPGPPALSLPARFGSRLAGAPA
jgi:hypothetical protein